MTPRLLSAAQLSSLSEFVATSLGLHFTEDRLSDLERGLVATARELGSSDAGSCADSFLSGAATRSALEVLASHLTVGETYFFRERESLEIFEQQIVPEWLRTHGGGERPLRIWSAGCCTGEEPYSIAMILDRLLREPHASRVTILATDINPRFLRKAAEGIYGQWSFRATPEWIRERYFLKRKDGRFEIDARIRSRVTFSYLNLADDVYPSLVTNTNAMDVIFCRNVLLYFNAGRAREVAGRFHRSLVEGGWLIVSPTETSNVLFSSFSTVSFPGAVLYRKTAEAEERAVPPVPGELPVQSATRGEGVRTSSPRPRGDGNRRPDHGGAKSGRQATAPRRQESWTAAARRCANEGKLDEAMEWCRRAIERDRLNPSCRYLLAAIQIEQGLTDAARESLRQALYLDPDFVLAHFSLGGIDLARGRRREAGRHLANALTSLQKHAGDDILPESDGLTAGRLTEIITSLMESLPA